MKAVRDSSKKVRARIHTEVKAVGGRVDPYLLWALFTRLKGQGDPRDPQRPWQIAAALMPGTTKAERRRLLATGFRLDPESTATLHVTAHLDDQGFVSALINPSIDRLELCRPLDQQTPNPLRLTGSPPRLKVEGLVIAVIDDACAFSHASFRHRDADGAWRSRIAYLWDQGADNYPRGWKQAPAEFGYGAELQGGAIDDWVASHTREDGSIDEDAVYEAASYAEPVAASIVHGTHVLDIAAGRPNPLRSGIETGAPDAAAMASIIFVQLPRSTVADTSGASLALFVIDAVRYVLNRVAADARVVVNLSYGSFAGAHDGTSLVESALDEALAQRKDFALVMGAGNAYDANCHASATLDAGAPKVTFYLVTRADDPTDTFVEFWWPEHHADATAPEIEVTVQPPGGAPSSGGIQASTTRLWSIDRGWIDPAVMTKHDTEPVAGVLRPSKTVLTEKASALALLSIAPTRDGGRPRPLAPHGVWAVTVRFVRARPGDEVAVDAWIERDDRVLGAARSRSQATFCDAQGGTPLNGGGNIDRRSTLGNTVCGKRAIVVGGALLDGSELASYSAAGPGRGSARVGGPDVVAPSEQSASVEGLLAAGTRSESWVRMNGTSVAAPVVARRLANLLEARAEAGEVPVSAEELKQLLLGEAVKDLPAGPAGPDLPVRRGGGFVAPAS